MTRPGRSFNVAILAMGGEGGGVLADWLVSLAEHNGYVAQTTSVPGVAQRTGATIYYVEMYPDAGDGRAPVFALMPFPGDVDVVLASELMEAGRAIQRGFVSPDRTTFIASSHRVYSMTEKTALGDGRVDSVTLLEAARTAAKTLIVGDFADAAERSGSVISAALFGALAASGATPFPREAFEDAIRRGGVGVQSSLAAFAEGAKLATPQAAKPDTPASAPAVGRLLVPLAERIRQEFPAAAHRTLIAGIERLADYQDIAYAESYLDRLKPVAEFDRRRADGGARLLDETARYLALWMSYEDTIRVADLKTRRSRFERVRGEVRSKSGQLLGIHEFMHPRVEEIADTLPEGLGRWLLGTPWARRLVGRFAHEGRVVKTSTVRGFLLLYCVASLRGMRRRTLRFRIETARIDSWLATVLNLAATDYDLAVAVAECQRLVKGYGDTHVRGWRNFEAVMAALPRLKGRPDAAAQVRRLRDAALADEHGNALATVREELAA